MTPTRPKNQKWRNKGSLEIVEEAVHLVRMAPASALFAYYVGSLPFILGFLFFWVDMSQSAFAHKHCAEASFFLGLLYLWMKCWQAVYAVQLKMRITGEPPLDWSPKRIARLAFVQTILQPYCFMILPLAIIITLPFGWAYAFYHNLSVMGDGATTDLRLICRRAWHQAQLWPGQNHVLISIFCGFGLFVFLNLGMAMFFAPAMLKTFFGIETPFTLSGTYFLNTTFFAALLGLSYLCLNPLIKAAYVLRCFYGESLHTGQDLKAELVMLGRKAVSTVFVLLGLFCVALEDSFAQDEPSDQILLGSDKDETDALPPEKKIIPREANRIESPELDRSIREVIQRREFTWRLPREKISEETEKGPFGNFLDDVAATFTEWGKSIKKRLIQFEEWIDEMLNRKKTGKPGTGMDWQFPVQLLVFILLALVASILAIVFLRRWKKGGAGKDAVLSQAVLPVPDIRNEDVQADQLPSDEWYALARQFLEKGDLRLALRAFYLSTLATLAQREIIQISRFKSNRDYQQELIRRASSKPTLISAFTENMKAFENAWYGMHEVTPESVRLFTENRERIQDHAQK